MQLVLENTSTVVSDRHVEGGGYQATITAADVKGKGDSEDEESKDEE